MAATSGGTETSKPVIGDFADVRNIARGSVIIMASGSSAKDFPLERFAGVPVITMNGAISMFADTATKPFFYICTDTSFPKQQPELFSQALSSSKHVALWSEQIAEVGGTCSAKLYPLQKAAGFSLKQAMSQGQSACVRPRFAWNARARSIGFSKDLSEGFFDARTVAYAALQLAYHLGFSRVFLVGVDLNQAAGRFYETADSAKSPCGLDQHYEGRVLPSLKLMAERVVDERFAVFNLSAASRIPASVIPKITVEQAHSMVFRKGGARPRSLNAEHPQQQLMAG